MRLLRSGLTLRLLNSRHLQTKVIPDGVEPSFSWMFRQTRLPLALFF